MGVYAFQSTLPVWGGTFTHQRDFFTGFQFQSTLPVWGGTAADVDRSWAEMISIHPPRVGRDGEKRQKLVEIVAFQSTLPVWGGTRLVGSMTINLMQFQSTLPVWGGTAKAHKNSL